MYEQLSDRELDDIDVRAGSTFWLQWRTLVSAAAANDEPTTIPSRELADLLRDHDALLAEVARIRAAGLEATAGGPVRFSGSAPLASPRHWEPLKRAARAVPQPVAAAITAEKPPEEAWDRAFTDVMNANVAAAGGRVRRSRAGQRLVAPATDG